MIERLKAELEVSPTSSPIRRTRRLNIYGDESSQTGHRFLVIGMLSCEAEREARVIAKLDAVIPRFRPTSEFKWTSMGKKELPMYKALVAAVFDTFKDENVRYHSIVVDRTKSNDVKFNEGDSDIGFSKYVFTLLNRYTFHHRTLDPTFKVYLDERETKHSLDITKRSLNRRAYLDYGHWRYPIFDSVEFVKSHEYRLVQAADVLTGAIAYIWNGHHQKQTASKHKLDMCDYIGGRMWGDRHTLGKPTLPFIEHRGIAIWLLDWEAQRRKALVATYEDQRLHIPAATTLLELRTHGFEINLTCPKCWRFRGNVIHPKTIALPFGGPFRCSRTGCAGSPIPILSPDPLKVPLFARPLAQSSKA